MCPVASATRSDQPLFIFSYILLFISLTMMGKRSIALTDKSSPCSPELPRLNAEFDHLASYCIRPPIIVFASSINGGGAVQVALNMHNHVDSGAQRIGAIEVCTAICVLALNGAAAARENRAPNLILDGPDIGLDHSRFWCVRIIRVLSGRGDKLCRNVPGSGQILWSVAFGQAAADRAQYYVTRKRG